VAIDRDLDCQLMEITRMTRITCKRDHHHRSSQATGLK
jgi:hypothetical protein